jgi:hypothetical protein
VVELPVLDPDVVAAAGLLPDADDVALLDDDELLPQALTMMSTRSSEIVYAPLLRVLVVTTGPSLPLGVMVDCRR